MSIFEKIKAFNFKDFSKNIFDNRVNNNDDTNDYVRMYGPLFLLLLLLYPIVEYYGFSVDRKVTTAIFYNMSGDMESANQRSILVSIIIHAVLVGCGSYVFKIRVNGLHKKKEHRPIFFTVSTFLIVAVTGTLTINVFADSFAKAESRMAQEQMLNDMEQSQVEIKTASASMLTAFSAAASSTLSKSQYFVTLDSAAAVMKHHAKVKAVTPEANRYDKIYKKDRTENKWAKTYRDKAWADTLSSYNDMINSISNTRKEHFNSAKTEENKALDIRQKQQTAALDLSEKKMQIKGETLDEMKANANTAGWFIRVQSTLIQLLSLLIALGIAILYRDANKTKPNKTNNLQTEAERVVLQLVASNVGGVLKLDSGVKSRIRNWSKRGFAKPVSDNQKLFEYAEHYMKRVGVFVEPKGNGLIEFVDINRNKL